MTLRLRLRDTKTGEIVLPDNIGLHLGIPRVINSWSANKYEFELWDGDGWKKTELRFEDGNERG